MKKSRFTALAIVAAMSVSLLAGCGGSSKPEQAEAPAETSSAASSDVQSGNVVVEASVMEEPASSVTVAVDDDSFTIGPWGGSKCSAGLDREYSMGASCIQAVYWGNAG